MAILTQLFSNAPPVSRTVPPNFLLASSVDPSTPKPPKIENCSRDALFWFLFEKQIIDIHGNIISEVPLDLPELTHDQEQRLIQTLEEPIPVHDKSGRKGFDITFNEIIGYINEFYIGSSIKPKIELVGGWVTKILDLSNHPMQVLKQFNIPGIEEFLKEHPLEEHFRNPPDRDLRIAIEGTSQKDRKRLFDFILDKIASKRNRSKENLEANFLSDFANPQDEKKQNCFLMFGMGDRQFTNIEVLAYNELRIKELFSPENAKLSVVNRAFSLVNLDLSKLRKVWQGLLDRLLHKTRINEPDSLDHYIWFKSHLYALQGLTIADPKDSKIVSEKLLTCQNSDEALLDLLLSESEKIIKKHCHAEPLNILAYLHSTREKLCEVGKESLFAKLWELLQPKFSKLEFCKIDPSDFRLFNHLVLPFAWICSRGEGNAKEKNCRIRSTTQTDRPTIELIAKGSRTLPHASENRSDYSFWVPFDVKSSWDYLVKAKIDESIISELFLRFIEDLKIEQLHDDGFNWCEIELQKLAEIFISSESPGKFRLGFWILLVSAVKSPHLINNLLKVVPNYFYKIETNSSIKAKAIQLFELVRKKANPNSSPAISNSLKNSDENDFYFELINDPMWCSVGLDFWSKKNSRISKPVLEFLLSKITRMNSALQCLDLIKKDHSDQTIVFVECLLAQKYFQPELISRELHNAIVALLLDNKRIKSAIVWIRKVGLCASVAVNNWKMLMRQAEAGEEKEQASELMQNLCPDIEELWDHTSIKQRADILAGHCTIANLRHAFNYIAVLERDGTLESNIVIFRHAVVKAIDILASSSFSRDRVMWEYQQAKNLIIKYPELFDNPSAKLLLLQKIINGILGNLKEYQKNYDSGWYVGIAQDYFNLYIQECSSNYLENLHIPDCICSYLDQMNYLSHPLSESIQAALPKLFPKIVGEYKKDKKHVQILKTSTIWSLRKIPIPSDKTTRLCFLYAYFHKGKDIAKSDMSHCCQLLEDLANEPPESFTEEEAIFAQSFIHNLKASEVILKLFVLIVKKVKDPKEILEFILRHVQRLFRNNQPKDAIPFYELPEFESKRGDVALQMFPLYVYPKADEAELFKGFNILKTYPNLPKNFWVLLLGFVSKKCTIGVLETIWKEYNGNFDTQLQPSERGQCWLYFLRGIKAVVSPLMLQTILSQDVIEAVYRVPGAETHVKEAMMTYLESAANYVRSSDSNKDIVIKLVEKILVFKCNFQKRKDLNPKEKETLCDITLNLYETKAKLDNRVDLAAQLEMLPEVLLLLTPPKATPKFVKFLQNCLQCPEKPTKTLLINGLTVIVLLNQLLNNEEIFDACLNFCTKSNDVDLISEFSKSVLSLSNTNLPLVSKKSKEVIALLFQLLTHYNDKDGKANVNVESMVISFYHMMDRKKIVGDVEEQKFRELLTKAKLFNLLYEESLSHPPDNLLIPTIEVILLYICSWNSPQVQKLLEDFYKECVKRKSFRMLFLVYSLAEFNTFYTKTSKYERPGKCVVSGEAIYQASILAKHPDLAIKYPKNLCPATNFQADYTTNSIYCHKLADFKLRNTDFFINLAKSEKDLYAKAAILDLLIEQFGVFAHLYLFLNDAYREQIRKCFDQFVYSVSYKEELFVPHTRVITTNGKDVDAMNMSVLVSDFITIGCYNCCPQKMIEYYIYAGFPPIILDKIKIFNFDDKEIILGISILFKRFEKDFYILSGFLQEIPASVFLKDHRTMMPLLAKFFENFPNFYQENREEFEVIMAKWIKAITADIFRRTVKNEHMEFMNFLKSKFFNLAAVTLNIRYLLKYIMEQTIKEKRKYVDDVIGSCTELPL